MRDWNLRDRRSILEAVDYYPARLDPARPTWPTTSGYRSDHELRETFRRTDYFSTEEQKRIVREARGDHGLRHRLDIALRDLEDDREL